MTPSITPALGIVFSIRPSRHLGLDTVRRAVFRAGFVCNDAKLVLTGRNTRAVLAVLSFTRHLSVDNAVNGIDVKLGKSIEAGMGSRLLANLEHLVDDLDATICNAEGAALTLEALNAIAAEIDATAAHRIVNPPALPPTKRVPGLLSFTHEVTTARGRWIDDVHFEPKSMTHYAGQREGLRRAGELLSHIKQHGAHRVSTARIIAAALGVTMPYGTCREGSVDNVASGFIKAVAAMLEGAAHHIDHAGYIERAIAQSIRDEQFVARHEKERHHKTAVKAAATRKARRAAKAVTA